MKKAAKPELRISGLVSLMNRVRAQWNEGIPTEQAAAFRALVRDSIRTVETLCRSHHVKPDDLPVQTRRAYQYLKGLDLRYLPRPQDKAASPSTKAPRVTGVLARSNYYHAEFRRMVQSGSNKALWRSDDPAVSRLARRMRSDADAIAALCAESGAAPADLPTPSRRGYQWLTYLSEPVELARHLATLQQLTYLTHDPALQRHLHSQGRTLPVHFQIMASDHLYRTHFSQNGYKVVVSEGYIGAEPDTLAALVRCTLDAAVAGDRECIKDYSMTKAFADIQMALAGFTPTTLLGSKGQHFDLDAVFDRVNAAYFKGALTRPRLVWSKSHTRRKLGHYDPLRDVVMLSLSLDDARIPVYVIDFTMYHELLHKHLGVHVNNGRRYAHTSAFRDAERQFKEYDQAQAYWSKPGKRKRQANR